MKLTNCLLAGILLVLSVFAGRYWYETAKQDAFQRIAKIDRQLEAIPHAREADRRKLENEKRSIQDSWDI